MEDTTQIIYKISWENIMMSFSIFHFPTCWQHKTLRCNFQCRGFILPAYDAVYELMQQNDTKDNTDVLVLTTGSWDVSTVNCTKSTGIKCSNWLY